MGTRLKRGFNVELSVLILALLVRAIARVGLDEAIAPKAAHRPA